MSAEMKPAPCRKCNGQGYREYLPPHSRVLAVEPCDCTRPRDPAPVNGSFAALAAALASTSSDLAAVRVVLAAYDVKVVGLQAKVVLAEKALEEIARSVRIGDHKGVDHEAIATALWKRIKLASDTLSELRATSTAGEAE